MKLKDQKLVKIEAPFMDVILGLAIIKILDKNVQRTMMLKLKFVQNLAILDVRNTGLETLIFNPNEVIGILDLNQWVAIISSKVYYSKI